MTYKKNPLSFCSGYGWTEMPHVIFRARMNACIKRVKQLQEELGFDAVAFAGSSGAAIAFVLGYAIDIPVIYVRKDTETHHGSSIECNSTSPIHKYLIVDDFVDAGGTVTRIYNKIRKYAQSHFEKVPACVGVFLYCPTTDGGHVTIHNTKKRLKIYTTNNE